MAWRRRGLVALGALVQVPRAQEICVDTLLNQTLADTGGVTGITCEQLFLVGFSCESGFALGYEVLVHCAKACNPVVCLGNATTDDGVVVDDDDAPPLAGNATGSGDDGAGAAAIVLSEQAQRALAGVLVVVVVLGVILFACGRLGIFRACTAASRRAGEAHLERVVAAHDAAMGDVELAFFDCGIDSSEDRLKWLDLWSAVQSGRLEVDFDRFARVFFAREHERRDTDHYFDYFVRRIFLGVFARDGKTMTLPDFIRAACRSCAYADRAAAEDLGFRLLCSTKTRGRTDDDDVEDDHPPQVGVLRRRDLEAFVVARYGPDHAPKRAKRLLRTMKTDGSSRNGVVSYADFLDYTRRNDTIFLAMAQFYQSRLRRAILGDAYWKACHAGHDDEELFQGEATAFPKEDEEQGGGTCCFFSLKKKKKKKKSKTPRVRKLLPLVAKAGDVAFEREARGRIRWWCRRETDFDDDFEALGRVRREHREAAAALKVQGLEARRAAVCPQLLSVLECICVDPTSLRGAFLRWRVRLRIISRTRQRRRRRPAPSVHASINTVVLRTATREELLSNEIVQHALKTQLQPLRQAPFAHPADARQTTHLRPPHLFGPPPPSGGGVQLPPLRLSHGALPGQPPPHQSRGHLDK